MISKYISLSPKSLSSRINSFEQFENIAKTPLIHGPTPTYPLKFLGKEWGHGQLYIKREDLTSSVYGGNKVRNLEYLLGEFEKKGFKEIITASPAGSNFTAALAAITNTQGIKCSVDYFQPHINDHILIQKSFCYFHNIHCRALHNGPTWLSASKAFLEAKKFAKQTQGYFIAPGGSSVTGALGHVGAALEFARQVKSFEIPIPDLIVVGAGTCGTIAGLLVGLKISGLKSRLIGVRCVDKIICNRIKIASLANQTLRHLGQRTRVSIRDIELIDTPGEPLEYAVKHPEAKHIHEQFQSLEGISLDSTYTSKVALALKGLAEDKHLQSQKILYWHTFSNLAHEWYKNLSY